jgi:hypothetical protein
MIKLVTEESYKKIIKNPEKYGIEMSLSQEEKAYSLDRKTISEMFYGAYTNFGKLKVDEKYFIDINSAFKIICELEKVSLTDKHNSISIKNIRTFYIKDYYLITADKFNGNTKHKISDFLVSCGHINKGRSENKDLYSTQNSYKSYQYYNRVKAPKDLFHPIKLGINDTFFSNQFAIDNFELQSNIIIQD